MNDKTNAPDTSVRNGPSPSHGSGSIAQAPEHSATMTRPTQPTTAYTPGPYTIRYDRDGCDEYFQIVDTNGSVLASVLFWGEVPGDRDKALANARLFATAPELLVTLQELLDVVSRFTGADLPAEFYAAEARAYAVVAKTQGRD
jgi:hypothetical protein